MADFHRFVQSLLGREIFLVVGGISVVVFLATALLVPVALARMPSDYFTRGAPAKQPSLLLRVLKNTAGVVLILLGIAMLVLPGQGIITVALGLGLVDFPGRRRFELAVIGRPGVLKTVNALRAKFGREPLDPPRRG